MFCKPGRDCAALQRGFTLIELMVTLSIVAILGLLAAPSVQSLMGKIRMNGISTQFTGHLLRARTEAVNRNACTVMCISANTTTAITADGNGDLTAGPTCSNATGNWQAAAPAGWIVFFKEDCMNTTDAPNSLPARPEDYLAVQTTSTGSDYHLDPTGDAQVNKFFFGPNGRPLGPLNAPVAGVASFSLYYQTSGSALSQQYGQKICVDVLGRSRTISSSQNC